MGANHVEQRAKDFTLGFDILLQRQIGNGSRGKPAYSSMPPLTNT
jgi:hypothetical protein